MYNCIINFEDKEIINELESLGYNCIPTVKSTMVSKNVCRHADMLYLVLDRKNIIISSCQKENMQFLQDKGFFVTLTDILKPGYKTESYLNFSIAKNTIIYNPKTAIVEKMDECDFFNNYSEKIKVKQGYTRCSTITIDDNTFITEDEGIYNILTANQKDCLLIAKGFVHLKGYDYGFIGGASVMLKNLILLFFGDIRLHPENDRIIQFLYKHNVTVKFIKDKPLEDIGGAIVI